jgi:hypothetical protein
MSNAPLTRAQTYLLLALGLSTNGVQAQGQLQPGHLYLKKEITGKSGIQQLIDSNTRQTVGTSSFDGQRLPTGTKMVIERVRLSLAVVNSDNGVSAAGQTYANKSSTTEAKFRAANFIINRDGKEIFKVGVANCLTLDSVQGMVGVDDTYDVRELRLLQGDEKLEIQLEFPDDVDWTAGKKVFVNIELFGPQMQF